MLSRLREGEREPATSRELLYLGALDDRIGYLAKRLGAWEGQVSDSPAGRRMLVELAAIRWAREIAMAVVDVNARSEPDGSGDLVAELTEESRDRKRSTRRRQLVAQQERTQSELEHLESVSDDDAVEETLRRLQRLDHAIQVALDNPEDDQAAKEALTLGLRENERRAHEGGSRNGVGS